jgi:hypothetical protein
LPEVKKSGDFGKKIYNKLVKAFPALADKPATRRHKTKPA